MEVGPEVRELLCQLADTVLHLLIGQSFSGACTRYTPHLFNFPVPSSTE
jgi:hypothetical protein